MLKIHLVGKPYIETEVMKNFGNILIRIAIGTEADRLNFKLSPRNKQLSNITLILFNISIKKLKTYG